MTSLTIAVTLVVLVNTLHMGVHAIALVRRSELAKQGILVKEEPVVVGPGVVQANAVPVWKNAAPVPKNEHVVPTGTCISSCQYNGITVIGDFQSCKGCEVYATCAPPAGVFYDERPCQANYWGRPTFIWDDSKKGCIENSTTCTKRKGVAEGKTMPDIIVPEGTCITSCKYDGKAIVGDFQSCKGCEVYATCIPDGRFFDERPCQANHKGRPTFIWDDSLKKCVEKSKTCSARKPVVKEEEKPRIVPIGTCITSCKYNGTAIVGDFQSCQGCHVYATCNPQGQLFDGRNCQSNFSGARMFVWDDATRRCDDYSTTCPTIA